MNGNKASEERAIGIALSRDAALVLYGMLCGVFFEGKNHLDLGPDDAPSAEFWALSDVQVQLENVFMTEPRQDIQIAEAANRLVALHNSGVAE